MIVFLLLLLASAASLYLSVASTVAGLHGALDLSSVIVIPISLVLVAFWGLNLIALARFRIDADEKRVRLPTRLWKREVLRSELAAIHVVKRRSLFGRRMSVYQFVTRSGADAFSVPSSIFLERDIASLASYLGVPIDLENAKPEPV